MGRLSWAQLRFRTARSLALLIGMLLATTAFTVLTAASRTSQLRAIGTVTEHFHTAYDILVRPAGARTTLETQTGTVQPNFLSGIYGGISMRQYHKIAAMPGVQVAASPRSACPAASSHCRPGCPAGSSSEWPSPGP